MGQKDIEKVGVKAKVWIRSHRRASMPTLKQSEHRFRMSEAKVRRL